MSLEDIATALTFAVVLVSRDPGDDPAAIFDALPSSHRARFRAEYDQALDAAHDLERFKQVQTLLRQWRLRALAYGRQGYEEAVQDALQGPRMRSCATPERPGEPAVRHAFFGEDDQGMLTFIVDEQIETLRIIDILWAG